MTKTISQEAVWVINSMTDVVDQTIQDVHRLQGDKKVEDTVVLVVTFGCPVLNCEERS